MDSAHIRLSTRTILEFTSQCTKRRVRVVEDVGVQALWITLVVLDEASLYTRIMRARVQHCEGTVRVLVRTHHMTIHLLNVHRQPVVSDRVGMHETRVSLAVEGVGHELDPRDTPDTTTERTWELW